MSPRNNSSNSLHGGVNEFAINEFSVSGNGPAKPTEDKARSQRDVDDDLFLGGFFIIPYGNQVAPTHPPDPPGYVQEQDPGCNELSPVPLVPAHNQMGQPVWPAQQPLIPVVVEPGGL